MGGEVFTVAVKVMGCPWVEGFWLEVSAVVVELWVSVELFSRIETVKELKSATARSSFPSPLKSPIATATGKKKMLPTDVDEAKLKVACPIPNQDGNGVTGVVGKHQVRVAVCIEV